MPTGSCPVWLAHNMNDDGGRLASTGVSVSPTRTSVRGSVNRHVNYHVNSKRIQCSYLGGDPFAMFQSYVEIQTSMCNSSQLKTVV